MHFSHLLVERSSVRSFLPPSFFFAGVACARAYVCHVVAFQLFIRFVLSYTQGDRKDLYKSFFHNDNKQFEIRLVPHSSMIQPNLRTKIKMCNSDRYLCPHMWQRVEMFMFILNSGNNELTRYIRLSRPYDRFKCTETI